MVAGISGSPTIAVFPHEKLPAFAADTFAIRPSVSMVKRCWYYRYIGIHNVRGVRAPRPTRPPESPRQG